MSKCTICPKSCDLSLNPAGFCGGRLNYGKVTSMAVDPIEKKPLRLFCPGHPILSIGSFGCNLTCGYCQNHRISQEEPPVEYISPERLVELALEVPDNIGIAYTYNEPLIGYDFVYDCAKLIHDAGLCNVLVTNGYINRKPLEKLLPLIDAMNIDLKSFHPAFYQNTGGDLETVKESIVLARKYCHVEVTTLVIPGENDGDIDELSAWLASVDPEIPLHLSRFFPRHKYSNREPTPNETIMRLCEIARQHLKNVFAGNM